MSHSPSRPARWHEGLLYGCMGLPLAFMALPLYVILPDHYARQFGVPLTTLAGVLLATRLLDALVDPWIGRWVDQQLDQSPSRLWRYGVLAAACLATGFTALFFPPAVVRAEPAELVPWCAGALVVTYAAYSTLMVAHQAWGARLGGGETQQVTFVAWREGMALVGVLLASMLPSLAGMPATAACFAILLGGGWACLAKSPQPRDGVAQAQPSRTLWENVAIPWRNRGFLRLLLVFLLNGIAMAIPANLVIFFITDRLQDPNQTPLLLATYFGAAALSTPGWARLVRRLGLLRCWGLGMGLSVLSFLGALLLGAGDTSVFVLICALSGIALGADLSLPGAILVGVIQRAGHQGSEGAYFGWWNFANKLNLALAAGISLPVLNWLGYAPGQHDEGALQALSLAYCLVPCLFKMAAGGALYLGLMRPERSSLLTHKASP